MDAKFVENCAIKSEVSLTETFASCGKYENDRSAEELFKCKKEEEDLEEHMDILAAPMQQYSYNECNFTTTEKEVSYFCKEYNFATRLECSIKEHLNIHNRAAESCIIEEFNSKTSQTVSPPSKTQRSSNIYICNECNYTTLNKHYLRQHMRFHTDAKYTSKKCDYKTWNKHYFTAHVKKQLLRQHVKIHTGGEYKCTVCKYKTTRKAILISHMKIHTSNKYNCKDCDYKTVWKNNLKAHVKIHTDNEHNCKECDYKTAWKHLLKEHVKIHTGDEYKCKECEYKTVQKNNLKPHMKIQNVKMSVRGNKCCYFGCGISKNIEKDIRMYTFPIKDKERCEQWIQNAGNEYLFDLDTDVLKKKTICEKHFSLECFRNVSKHRLVWNAVPFPYDGSKIVNNEKELTA